MAKSTKKSRRQRNPQREQQPEQKNFFSKGGDSAFFQPSLKVGKPNDPYEREADKVASSIVSHQSGQAPGVQHNNISAVQKSSLSSPAKDERLGTAEARMEEDKAIQEKPLLQAMEEEESVQAMEEEESVQAMEEEEPVQAMEEEEPVQAMEEEESVQAMEEEESVQAMEEEESVQAMEEEESVQAMEEEESVQAMEEEEMLQTAKKGGATAQPQPIPIAKRLKSRAGQGQPLPPVVRQQMEQALGADLSQVRIHTDTEAAAMSQQLGAKAFTNGTDIYFNEGKYQPTSRVGQELLAHELTHVVQQSGGSKAQKKQSATND